MAAYSESLISMVSYGLLRAKDDHEFFRETVRRAVPHVCEDSLNEIARLKREMDLEQTLKAAKGACLIFMHAGLEACLVVLAKIAAKLDEKAWYPLIENKKFSVGELNERSLVELLADQVAVYLSEMERQSLVEKSRTLFRVLRPGSSPMIGFTFDETRLERIQGLRNDCAHGRVGVTDLSIFYDDLEYLRQVGDYFIEVVAKKFSLKNPKDEFLKASKPAP